MSEEELKYFWVLVLVVAAFLPVTINAIRQRRENPPPMAKHDRKLYRMWKSDPEGYLRKYGDMDRQYLEAQEKKKKGKEKN